MKVDLQQFIENGYVILKDCVPPEQLDELRDSSITSMVAWRKPGPAWPGQGLRCAIDSSRSSHIVLRNILGGTKC